MHSPSPFSSKSRSPEPLSSKPPSPDYDFRAPDDWSDFTEVVGLAYGGYDHSPEHRATVAELLEPKRSLLACAAGRPCATLAGYSLDMTLPGTGPRPVFGIGYVAVSPAHRRRGLMRDMILRVLSDLHTTRAEPVAVLNATEPALYGRFGFGAASQAVSLTIPVEARALAEGPADDGPPLTLEVTSPAEAEAAIARVCRACLAERPGMLRREGAWLRQALADPPADRHGAGRLLCMLATDGAGVRGYALYRLTAGWTHSYPRYTVSVQELSACDPAAYAFLWRALLDVDLGGTVTADARPVDDPVLALLADPRSAAPTVRDQLYARAVDVDRALSGRGYATEAEVVLEVTDPLCPWNEGRWRLITGTTGADCVRTRANADLALTARELGAILLGGGSLVQLARAGRVAELRPGAVQAAAAAFRHDPAPYCPVVF
ncbi:GNAT family N-acetyltransferase [Streptomyces ochraceiscleroticus]|uniref:GNAT family N-acetyltransferase n=1 Tax=Streptomyces ochraceiscleroticus TaxID=47761 RepID=A0ABW1MHR9_9ACTN|nr:GNAT family N-acetyltransferase [Streptomyces ochraceiscleroticus]